MALSLCAVLSCAVRQEVGVDEQAEALQPDSHNSEEAPWNVTENLKYEEVQAELLHFLESKRSSKSISGPRKLLHYLKLKLRQSPPKFKKKKRLRKVLDKLWKLHESGRASSSGCQLGGLLAKLFATCIDTKNEIGWGMVGQMFMKKIRSSSVSVTNFCDSELKFEHWNCRESASDIFLYGQELVQTLQIPEEQKTGLLPKETLLLVQSFCNLCRWLLPIATSAQAAMLWAGFWNDPEDSDSRTSKDKLFDFAEMIDHQTVHPATQFGRFIEEQGDLDKCYSDKSEDELTQNMWSFASMSFVMGMKEKKQSAWDPY